MSAVIGLRLRTAAKGLKPIDPEVCAQQTLMAIGAQIESVIDDLDAMRDLALSIATEADAAGRQVRRSDLLPIQALAKERLVRPSLISGTGMVYAAGILANLLIRAAGQAVLVTKRGRIVASNDPSRLVGTLWDPGAAADGEPGALSVTAGQRIVTEPRLGWSVVIDARKAVARDAGTVVVRLPDARRPQRKTTLRCSA